MYFLGLAADFDGTIGEDGTVKPETLAALRRLKETDRRLLLVTGRELPAILLLLPDPTLFDRIIAENGALLYDPLTRVERLLAPSPPEVFVQRLHERNVRPLSIGRCVISTWEPHQNTVLDAIHEFGLDLQIAFNKGAVMVLPSGINKATGLQAALDEMVVSIINIVGVGDAENDLAFLRACGCSAAVANALPVVSRDADLPLAGDHGAGIIELIDRLIDEDSALAPENKHGPWLGWKRDDRPLHLRPGQGCALVLGPSGTGKSTLATALSERLAERRLNFCIVDPEGDYLALENTTRIGSLDAPPSAAEALRLVSQARVNVVVNTQAMGIRERQALFIDLLHQTTHLRARTGFPHWLLIDEAHQLLPRIPHDGPEPLCLYRNLSATILVTLSPDALSDEALRTVFLVLALGPDPQKLIQDAAELLGYALPSCPVLLPDEALCWTPGLSRMPVPIRLERPRQEHYRHAGKYAVGNVGDHHSFYFHDLQHARFLKANNLYSFIDIAQIIDDRSWEKHLRAGDFSSWFLHIIKDDDLARDTAQVEADTALDAAESRRLIRKAIWRRYAAPVLFS